MRQTTIIVMTFSGQLRNIEQKDKKTNKTKLGHMQFTHLKTQEDI